MDKKTLLIKSLARIMVEHIDSINLLVKTHSGVLPQDKADGSPVTALDIALSDLIEKITLEELGENFTFYSEEKFGEWAFPLLALDPLDGTREFIAGRPEWVVSLGLFKDENFQGQGWIYNPLTKECFTEESLASHEIKKEYSGEVSRSEWSAGLYKNCSNHAKYKIKPMGSIAYKLGKLSAGKLDFVVSLKPKNIWDIAGGTLLCQKAGMKFYSQGKEVSKVAKRYEPPLIWCHERNFLELSELFS